MAELPVLIYVGKQNCPGCLKYNPEWEDIVQRLHGKARLVKFTCTNQLPPPPPIDPYVEFFPTVLLAAPRSYFKCFTQNDQINYDQCMSGYVIKGIKMDPKNGYTAKDTVQWFNQNAPYLRNLNQSLR